LKYYFKFSCW